MGWLGALRTLLVISAAAHLAWEVVQLPLYTIWWTGTAAEIAFAVVHCTAGDLVIMTSSLVAALVALGQGWPSSKASFRNVMLATIVIGVAYTIYSEWLNVSVRGTWAYTTAMPLVPPLGTGLLPLLQWIAVPGVAFVIVRRRVLADAARSKSPGPPLA
jgi:hypothetical protein